MNKLSWKGLLLMVCSSLLLLVNGCKTEVAQESSGVEYTVERSEEKPQEVEEIHWSYGGASNPTRWGEISPEYVLCERGTAQSPINIENISQQKAGKIEFNYQPTALTVTNKGHTIQVDYKAGSSIAIDGEQYELLQYHFHTPSEHHINKNAYAMELHLVHKNQQNQLAVVGVMIKEGNSNPVLTKIWEHTPQNKGEKQVTAMMLNAKELLPVDRSHYTYTGSLTTPPCSEGVRWNVLVTPIEASEEQISQFMELYAVNARPVQPLNDRQIVLQK